MSTVKSKKLQVGTDATSSNNFTIYQPATPDGTLRIGVGNADSPTEVGRFNSNGYVATNAPAFSATMSTSQSIPNATSTKLQFDTEVFDTAGNYDTANYRFTPSVAGYYFINASAFFDGNNSNGAFRIEFYKNGGLVSRGANLIDDTASDMSSNGSYLMYCNGTTDYIEIYFYQSSGLSRNVYNNTTLTYFQAHLARAT